MQKVTLDVDFEEVILDKRLLDSLSNNSEFKFISLDEKGTPVAVFRETKVKLVKLAQNKPKYYLTYYKNKDKRNVSSDNLVYKPIKGKEPKKSDRLKGAYFSPKKISKKWLSLIRINGKTKHIGYYRTEEEAHLAYLNEAKKVGRVL